MQEIARCQKCSCDACMRACDLMRLHEKTPRRLYEEVYITIHPGTLSRDGTWATRLSQVESSLAAAESVAVTSDVALRHLSVDSDGPLARLPIVAKGTRLHHRDAHVEPPYRDVPLDIDGHSYAVA